MQQREYAEVRDRSTLAISVFVRLLRVMLLWVILYFVDRAYQAIYIEHVMSRDGNMGESVMQLKPRLWSMILVVFMIEAVFLLVVWLILSAFKKRFKLPGNTFVIDDALLKRLVVQYLSTLVLLVPIGMLFGYAMQSCKELRYRDDGLRGIRALAVLLLITCVIVVGAVP